MNTYSIAGTIAFSNIAGFVTTIVLLSSIGTLSIAVTGKKAIKDMSTYLNTAGNLIIIAFIAAVIGKRITKKDRETLPFSLGSRRC